MPMELQYRIIFQAVTPRRHALRQANDLWVVEVTDDFTLSQNKAWRRPDGPEKCFERLENGSENATGGAAEGQFRGLRTAEPREFQRVHRASAARGGGDSGGALDRPV